MDGRRFDGIAQAWASGVNRRAVLHALAALLLGGNAVRAPLPAAAQDAFDLPCASNADCRANVPDRCIHARCRDGRCAYAAIRCAAGSHCCGNGRCCEDAFASPACLSDADCATSDPCANSRCQDGLCIALVVDCAPGYVCCGSAECCPAP